MIRSHDTARAAVAGALVWGLALCAPALAADPRASRNRGGRYHCASAARARVPEPPRIAPPQAVSPLFSSRELPVPAGLRLLVFAPHPDDETLAAAGLIQRVQARHGTVRVVFVTNGDGYVDGVRREVQRSETSRGDFIEYGRRRHDEALRAISRLGLQPADARFLGFPDDGIDDLWAGHWSPERPYRSPYTHAESPPYRESFNRRVEYAGTDLKVRSAACCASSSRIG